MRALSVSLAGITDGNEDVVSAAENALLFADILAAIQAVGVLHPWQQPRRRGCCYLCEEIIGLVTADV